MSVRQRVAALRARRAQGRLLRSLVLACGLALAVAMAMALVASLAAAQGGAPAPSPAPAPDSAARTQAPGVQVRRAGGPVSAPWDTAGRARETRRNHVYPRGESDVARRLLATLPEPATLFRGITSEDSDGSPARQPIPAAPNDGGFAPPDTGLARPGAAATAPPVPAPAPATGPAAPGPRAAAPAVAPDGCWEVQVLVTSDPRRAQAICDDLARRLDVPARVVPAGGTWRVRCGGCLSGDAAMGLVMELRDQGYPEAFRVRSEP